MGPDKATVVLLLPFLTKSQRAQSPRRSWLGHPEEGKKRLPMLAVPKLLSCHPGRRLGVKGVGREPGSTQLGVQVRCHPQTYTLNGTLETSHYQLVPPEPYALAAR